MDGAGSRNGDEDLNSGNGDENLNSAADVGLGQFSIEQELRYQNSYDESYYFYLTLNMLCG